MKKLFEEPVFACSTGGYSSRVMKKKKVDWTHRFVIYYLIIETKIESTKRRMNIVVLRDSRMMWIIIIIIIIFLFEEKIIEQNSFKFLWSSKLIDIGLFFN